jgi:hypothetical protein
MLAIYEKNETHLIILFAHIETKWSTSLLYFRHDLLCCTLRCKGCFPLCHSLFFFKKKDFALVRNQEKGMLKEKLLSD